MGIYSKYPDIRCEKTKKKFNNGFSLVLSFCCDKGKKKTNNTKVHSPKTHDTDRLVVCLLQPYHMFVWVRDSPKRKQIIDHCLRSIIFFFIFG